jgi:ribose transport system substrate-binding protein
MSRKTWLWLCVALAAVAAFYYRDALFHSGKRTRPRVALVVGGTTPFWQVVIDGARESAHQNNVELTVFIPEEGGTDQTRQLMTIDPTEYEGIAISPLRPDDQTRTISRFAAQTNVVTYDNDAPESLRHSHVGINNYVAGNLCGELVKKALPDGGVVAIFVGDHTRENAQLRRQGLVDALKEQKRIPGADLDPVEKPIDAGKYKIVETYLDGNLPAKGKENAKAALEKYPDLNCMVALYGYNGPACLEALADGEKLGKVQVVAFDEFEPTLKAIEAGNVFATIVQDEYRYGFESVRLLAEMSRAEKLDLPVAGSGSNYLPCMAVTKENIAEYRNKLTARRDGAAKKE